MVADAKLKEVKSAVLNQQENSCANCGVDFSEDDLPEFRYLLPPDEGGDESEENIEALCSRCFGDVGAEKL